LLLPASTVSEAHFARYLEQFCYCAQNRTLAAHVESLSQAYKGRPMTLFRVSYARRAHRRRSL
jgi:hypothetical protein